MRVKGDNLKLISGLLLSSFILNYILIRVKEKKDLNKKDRKNREKREKRSRERGTKKKAKILRISLRDHNSSVEVGYGLCYFIVNS